MIFEILTLDLGKSQKILMKKFAMSKKKIVVGDEIFFLEGTVSLTIYIHAMHENLHFWIAWGTASNFSFFALMVFSYKSIMAGTLTIANPYSSIRFCYRKPYQNPNDVFFSHIFFKMISRKIFSELEKILDCISDPEFHALSIGDKFRAIPALLPYFWSH